MSKKRRTFRSQELGSDGGHRSQLSRGLSEGITAAGALGVCVERDGQSEGGQGRGIKGA